MVGNQSKWIYEQIRDNKAHWVKKDLDTFKITEERSFPKGLGKQAKDNVFKQLTETLTSEQFRKHTKETLGKNLGDLIEAAVTKNNQELTEKGRNLIRELTPLAIDSLLLLTDKDEVKKEEGKKKIIEDAMESIKKNFDFEEIMFDRNFAEMSIKAELHKNIECTLIVHQLTPSCIRLMFIEPEIHQI